MPQSIYVGGRLLRTIGPRFEEIKDELAVASCGAALHKFHWSVVGDATMSVPTPTLYGRLRNALNSAPPASRQGLGCARLNRL